MQEEKTWKMLLKHLAKEDSREEKELFSKWLNEDKKNKVLFSNIKSLWDEEIIMNESFKPNIPLTFFGRFTKHKIKDFIIKKAVGNLIAFIIGFWVTNMFSHNVLEKRGVKNLFGLVGRKKIIVNEIPEYLQQGIAILMGFIALELINHFFETKKHMMIWAYMKEGYIKIKEPSNTKN